MNIFLATDAINGIAKLDDFGCSKQDSSSTNSSIEISTALYYAPENYEDVNSDKLDIWALAVTTFN